MKGKVPHIIQTGTYCKSQKIFFVKDQAELNILGFVGQEAK